MARFKDNAHPFISETELSEIVARLGAQITHDYQNQELIAIVILKGSVVFASDLVRQIKLPMKIDFVRLSSYGHGTESSGTVRIIKDITMDITGKNIIIIEDILDTGHTLTFFTNHIKASKPASVKICTLLDKPSRRKAFIKADYCGKTIEDRFVVGYGLDVAEKCRNYRNILYVKT